MDKKPLTEARKRANAKYNAKAYDPITIRTLKGKKEDIQNHADKRQESVNGFINRAIDETMKNDIKAGE